MHNTTTIHTQQPRSMVLVARGGRLLNQLPNPNNRSRGGHWYLKHNNPIDPKELGFSLKGGYPQMPYNNSLTTVQGEVIDT